MSEPQLAVVENDLLDEDSFFVESINDENWDDDLFEDLDLSPDRVIDESELNPGDVEFVQENFNDLSGSTVLPDDWADFDYG